MICNTLHTNHSQIIFYRKYPWYQSQQGGHSTASECWSPTLQLPFFKTVSWPSIKIARTTISVLIWQDKIGMFARWTFLKSLKNMFRNTYYSKTRIISCRFWKTSLRWTILLESVQADSMAISCRISMEQSWPIRTLEQNLAAYVMPVSRWTHFLTVVKMPLKNNQKRKFVVHLNMPSI